MDRNILAFSVTEIGYNHTKIQKLCEDASDAYEDSKMRICVVADGHGSDNYPRTDRGSWFAVDAALQCIKEFIENADHNQVLQDEYDNYRLLTQLSKSILKEWYQAVEDDYNQYPFEAEELKNVSDKYKTRYLSDDENIKSIEKAYGCTLIAFAITDLYSFGLQIGDGKCVVIDQYGQFSEPIPWDENCQLNVTTSICDSDAINEFRYYVCETQPAAVFCGTDGVDDSYASEEELFALYRSILTIFKEHGTDVGKKEIENFLPILSKKGSGDDVSIGCLIDTSIILNLSPIFDLQAEIFKTSAELNKKRSEVSVAVEKRKSLHTKMNQSFFKNQIIRKDADKIDEITLLLHEKENEISELEKKINSLHRQQQELVFDREAASFEEEKEELQNSIDDTGCVQPDKDYEKGPLSEVKVIDGEMVEGSFSDFEVTADFSSASEQEDHNLNIHPEDINTGSTEDGVVETLNVESETSY